MEIDRAVARRSADAGDDGIGLDARRVRLAEEDKLLVGIRRTDDELDAIYARREVAGWARYMAHPELKAKIESLGITSLAQFYTSEAKYDPDAFRRDSGKLRSLLEAKHFLP